MSLYIYISVADQTADRDFEVTVPAGAHDPGGRNLLRWHRAPPSPRGPLGKAVGTPGWHLLAVTCHPPHVGTAGLLPVYLSVRRDFRPGLSSASGASGVTKALATAFESESERAREREREFVPLWGTILLRPVAISRQTSKKTLSIISRSQCATARTATALGILLLCVATRTRSAHSPPYTHSPPLAVPYTYPPVTAQHPLEDSKLVRLW
jgi:hypothetical protein